MAVSRHVDAENRAQVLCKRSPCSQPLRVSSVPFQHCKIVVKFMLATNTMRGGEGGFTAARWGRSLGLLFLELFGGAPSSAFPECTMGKLPSPKISVPAPTGTW